MDISSILVALKTGSNVARRSAAASLKNTRDPRAVEALITALREDEDDDVRLEVVKALGSVGDNRSVGPLFVASRDLSWYVRDEARQILDNLGVRRDVGLLSAVMQQDEDEDARKEAAAALGNLGDKRAVEPLIVTLEEDESEGVRSAVASALGSLGDNRAVEPLIAALQHDEGEHARRAVASALSYLGDRRAVEPLIVTLEEDESEDIRSEAVRALGSLGDRRAVEPLIAVVRRDENEYMRRIAASALGDLGDKRAVEPLITTFQEDEDWYMRQHAASILGKLADPTAINALILALDEERQDAYWWAERLENSVVEALVSFDLRAADLLTAALGSDSSHVRSGAVLVLTRLGPRVLNQVVDYLTSDSALTREVAVIVGRVRVFGSFLIVQH